MQGYFGRDDATAESILVDRSEAGAGAHPWSGRWLRTGDIVTMVNGRSIERPEQAVAVWEALRSSPNLVVHYRRGSEELALQFRIVDVS